MMKISDRPIYSVNNELVPSLLIASAFVLFCTEHLFHYPIALMSILGAISFFRETDEADLGNRKYLLGIFLLVWLPMLMGSFDAVNEARSWKTTLLYLHFLPATYYVMMASSNGRSQTTIRRLVISFCLILLIDALIQFVFGQNVLGYPMEHDLITGMFYPKQRLALFLAVLAPIFLGHCLVQKHNRYLVLLGWFLYVFVILLCLKRNAWLMLFVGLFLYGLFHYKERLVRFAISVVGSFILVMAIIGITMSFNLPFNNQIKHSLGLVNRDLKTIDISSNRRLSLWTVGIRIFADNPINGIGPRGYRDQYKSYAAKDNFWIKKSNSGQTHPHSMPLEIAIETGLLGLFAYFFVLLLFFKKIGVASFRLSDTNYWLIAAAVGWMPLNTHLAFYGSYWASFVWLLIGLGLGYQRLIEN